MVVVRGRKRGPLQIYHDFDLNCDKLAKVVLWSKYSSAFYFDEILDQEFQISNGFICFFLLSVLT